jgi:Uma2 family endonuclease
MVFQAPSKPMTYDEFIVLAMQPENADRNFEFIGGEMIEVVSNNKASEIAGIFVGELYAFVRPRKLGRVTVPDGGYTISGEQYIPDCAFVSYQRQPQTSSEAYPTVAPELVIEVISPGNLNSTNERDKLTHKVANYLAAGCEVWLVYPDRQIVEVYITGQPVQTYRNGDVLEGHGLLKGFKVVISDLWPQ